MFLTKKADEAFNSLLKQAKEILSKKSKEDNKEADILDVPTADAAVEKAAPQDEHVSEIVGFIENSQITNAVEAFLKHYKDDNESEFRNSVAYAELLPEQKKAFESALDFAKKNENIVEEKDAQIKELKNQQQQAQAPAQPAPAPSPAPAEQDNAGSNDLDALLGDVGGSDTTPDTAGEASLNEIPDTGTSHSGSIFEYLKKKAEDASVVEPSSFELEDARKESIKHSVDHHLELGKDNVTAINDALNECGVEENPQYRKFAEDYVNNKTVNTTSIENHTSAVESLLNAVSSYTPEASFDEQVIELSKSSATAYEFLNKVAGLSKQANKLDEISGKQYPGQKQADGKQVTTDGGFGLSPQHPGQKVLSTREGGNAPVESNFPKAGKPEVDVFDKKSDKKGVVSINSLDGTIAFMQPLPFEKDLMGKPADYTGFVTGTTVQKEGNPEAAGPVAQAGHKTENYVDSIMEAADKKPAAEKKADFVFHGLQKTAAEEKDEVKKKPLTE